MLQNQENWSAIATFAQRYLTIKIAERDQWTKKWYPNQSSPHLSAKNEENRFFGEQKFHSNITVSFERFFYSIKITKTYTHTHTFDGKDGEGKLDMSSYTPHRNHNS